MTEPNGWLNKVQKLLAMAERTDNPAEAEAFSAKAEQLMMTYAIDQAMLDSARTPEEREKIVAVTMKLYAPYVTAKRVLVHNVAGVFNVQTLYTDTMRYSAKDSVGYSTLVGFTSDVEKVELLMTSLLIQQTRAIAVARPPYRANLRTFRTSFAMGFANTVINRVRKAYTEAKKEATSTSGTSTELALFDRKQLVKSEFDSMFPNRTKGRPVNISSAQGYRDGQAAGVLADLGQTRMSNAARTGINR